MSEIASPTETTTAPPPPSKPIEIDAYWGHLKPLVRAMLDLGAAPGGWNQVVTGKGMESECGQFAREEGSEGVWLWRKGGKLTEQ
jgi:hypothetical protein